MNKYSNVVIFLNIKTTNLSSGLYAQFTISGVRVLEYEKKY